MHRKLILFTHTFPYDKGEPFIEGELEYLSRAFKSIEIFPLSATTSNKRRAPGNCIVHPPFISRSLGIKIMKGLFNFSPLLFFIGTLFKYKHIIKSSGSIKLHFLATIYARTILSDRRFKTAIKDLTEQDILYFYWGTGGAYTLPFLGKINSKKVVRFHRGDLYEELYDGYLPYRKECFENIDRFIFISKNGQHYLQNKYPDYINTANAACFYLGTPDGGMAPVPSGSEKFVRIISCSFVHKIKRVDLIYYALQQINDVNIEWVHIGDGADFEALQRLCEGSKGNIHITLKGWMSKQEIYEFYRKEVIHLFVNVSSSEGLPVSIMEAVSFGIPVLATDVGGTSEIISDANGMLLRPDVSPEELAATILKIVTKEKYDRNTIKAGWKRDFSETENSRKFLEYLTAR